MPIFFGTSGNPPNFFLSKYRKDRLNAPEWLASIGLNAYEVLFTYGARMSEENAKKMGDNAKKFGIRLSVHTPYYCVFTSVKNDVVARSHLEMHKTIRLASIMGAKKIVLHPGFLTEINSLEKFISELQILEKWKKQNGFRVIICPEVMGKVSQLGSFEDVIEMCRKVPNMEPCIDFGHYHARTGGKLMKESDFIYILETIRKKLGIKSLKNLHCHFYPVEFNEKGEKRHRAHHEKEFYPHFAIYAKLIKKYKMEPTLISESRDSQDTGALEMKKYLVEK